MFACGQYRDLGRHTVDGAHHASRDRGHTAGVFQKVLRHLPAAQQCTSRPFGLQQYAAWRHRLAVGRLPERLCAAALQDHGCGIRARRHAVVAQHKVHVSVRRVDLQQLGGQIQKTGVLGNPGVDIGLGEKHRGHKVWRRDSRVVVLVWNSDDSMPCISA